MATVTSKKVIEALNAAAAKATSFGKSDLALLDVVNLVLWLIAEICFGSSLSSTDVIGAIAPSLPHTSTPAASMRTLTEEEKKGVRSQLRKKVAESLGVSPGEVKENQIPESALKKAYSEKELSLQGKARGRSVEPKGEAGAPRTGTRSESPSLKTGPYASAAKAASANKPPASSKQLVHPALSVSASESTSTLKKGERTSVLAFSCVSTDTWGEDELSGLNVGSQSATKGADGWITVRDANSGSFVSFKASKQTISYKSKSLELTDLPRLPEPNPDEKSLMQAKVGQLVQSLTSLWGQKYFTLLLVTKVMNALHDLEVFNRKLVECGCVSLVIIPAGFDVPRLQQIYAIENKLATAKLVEVVKGKLSIVGCPDISTIAKAQWETFISQGDTQSRFLANITVEDATSLGLVQAWNATFPLKLNP